LDGPPGSGLYPNLDAAVLGFAGICIIAGNRRHIGERLEVFARHWRACMLQQSADRQSALGRKALVVAPVAVCISKSNY
jgi:hypothetical protein